MKAAFLLLVLCDWRRPAVCASLSDLNRFPFCLEECRYQAGRYETLTTRLRLHLQSFGETDARHRTLWLAIQDAEEKSDAWKLLLSARAHANSGNETEAVECLNKLLWHLGEADYLLGKMPERFPPGWRFPGEDDPEVKTMSPAVE